MRNTIILSVILFLAVIAASVYYFKNLDNNHNQSSQSLRFLPANTLLIAAIGNDKEAENVFKDFDILDAFVGFDNVKLWNDFRTKLLNNPKVHPFFEGTDIYISFHSEKKQIEPLFTIPTSQAVPKTELVGIINEISTTYKTSTIDTLGHKIYQIQYGQKDSILNAIYYNDILFASPSLNILLKITDKHNKHLSDEQIDFFLKSNPRKTPLSIYFPHQQYDSIIDITQRSNTGPFVNLFKKLHGQSAWNINFKQDALILTGESQLDQYPENYASIFKNQQKTQQDLYRYFPSNTAIYAEFSVSNRAVFQKDLHALFKRRKEKIAENIDTTQTTAILGQALGDRFAFIETNAQNYIGFVNIKDSLHLNKLKGSVLENTTDSIGRFLQSGVLYKQYGDAFKELTRPYFTIIDSVLIVANNLSTLREYRKDYIQNDLLTGTLGFIKLDKIQGNEANITVFAHARNANSKFINALNQPFKDNFKDKDSYGYQDFFSWSIQLSGNNGNISSQIYAIYKSKNTFGITPEWTVSLNNRSITPPFVFAQSDTSQFIVLQELDHTIHALSPIGNKIWSKVFAGRVTGDLQQLEDRSIVFVTDKNNLYRIDTDGQSLKGFPKNIGSKPIGTPLLTTIKGQASIIIPTEKQVLAYDLNGNTVVGWENFEIEGTITTNIISQNGAFIFGTSQGNIYWINESGKQTDKEEIKTGSVSAIQLVNGYKIVALDNKGGVNLFVNNTDKKRWAITSDSVRFFGAFAHTINSNYPSLAIINSNRLQVFDIKDSLKNEYQYNFTKPIVDNLQFFPNSDNKNLFTLGLASKATNLIYLFGETGQFIEGFPIEGLPLFYYGKINYNSDIYLLCMRRDNKLYAFRQQK